jgi:branched-chain amino acid transport system substrate-binding protein
MRILVGIFAIFISLSGLAQNIESHLKTIETKQKDDHALNSSYTALIQIYEKQSLFNKSIEVCKKALFTGPTPNYRDPIRTSCIDLISNQTDLAWLEGIEKDSEMGFLRAYAAFRLGELHSLKSKDDAAVESFEKVISHLPETDIADRAQQLIEQIKLSSKVEPYTIGAVLPMSGKNSVFAQKTLRGIQMGLGLHSPTPTNFKLAIADSEGNVDGARRGVDKLVKEDNAIAIIGSLLSKTAGAVASRAAEYEVPSIGLSQKAGITEASPMSFRNSLTAEMQARFLVKTAMTELGITKFAILFPNESYGVEFANYFWDEVLARGGKISAVQFYDPKETDFREPIQRLVGTYYLEDRADEYRNRIKEWETEQNKRSRRSPPEDILPPIVDFEALFIPDNAKSFGQIAAMLSYNNIKNIKLLGTNILNVPDLAKRAGGFAEQTYFVDGLTPPSVAKNSFAREYRRIFNEDPSLFELQGYDSALAIKHAILSGADDREALAGALLKLKGFAGGSGKITMSPEKEILRPLYAFKLEKGEVVPIKLKNN